MSLVEVVFPDSHYTRIPQVEMSLSIKIAQDQSQRHPTNVSHNSESCLFIKQVPHRPTTSKTSTMVQELSYNVTSHVIESWEQLRRIKNYEEVAGVVLFQRCVRFISNHLPRADQSYRCIYSLSFPCFAVAVFLKSARRPRFYLDSQLILIRIRPSSLRVSVSSCTQRTWFRCSTRP